MSVCGLFWTTSTLLSDDRTMTYKLVKYRTSDYRWNQYAIIPDPYLLDFTDWLKLSECAKIIRISDNQPTRDKASGT